jgi:hypothetical protein
MESIKALRVFRDIYGEEIEKFGHHRSDLRKYLMLLGFIEIEILYSRRRCFLKGALGIRQISLRRRCLPSLTDGDPLPSVRGTGGYSEGLSPGSLQQKIVQATFTVGSMFRHESLSRGGSGSSTDGCRGLWD